VHLSRRTVCRSSSLASRPDDCRCHAGPVLAAHPAAVVPRHFFIFPGCHILTAGLRVVMVTLNAAESAQQSRAVGTYCTVRMYAADACDSAADGATAAAAAAAATRHRVSLTRPGGCDRRTLR